MKWLIQLHQYLNKEFSCTCLFCLCSASLMVKNIIFSREVLVFTLWCMLHNHQVCFSSRQWAVFHPLQRRAWLFPLLSRFESETGREEEGGGGMWNSGTFNGTYYMCQPVNIVACDSINGVLRTVLRTTWDLSRFVMGTCFN